MNNNIDYKNKYLKYKNKYMVFKNQIAGAIFNGIKYLGQGAENIAYDIGDNQVIRIMKKCKNIEESEKQIMIEINKNKPMNFVNIISIGNCADLVNKLNSKTTDFCNDTNSNVCNYEYVVLNKVSGDNINVVFLKIFLNLILNENLVIDQPENQELIEQFVNNLLGLYVKIADSFIDANLKLNGFRHGDFNYRNCAIDEEFNFTIYDFGASKIGAKTRPISEIDDILQFIKDSLATNSSEEPTQIHEVAYPGYSLLSVEKKNLINRNYISIKRKIMEHPKIQTIISRYFNVVERDTPNGRFKNIFPKDSSDSLDNIRKYFI